MSNTVTAMRHEHPLDDMSDAPRQFEWRNQLYLVREVLRHRQASGDLGHIDEWWAKAAPVQLTQARVFVLRFDWWDGSWTVEPSTSQEDQ